MIDQILLSPETDYISKKVFFEAFREIAGNLVFMPYDSPMDGFTDTIEGTLHHQSKFIGYNPNDKLEEIDTLFAYTIFTNKSDISAKQYRFRFMAQLVSYIECALVNLESPAELEIAPGSTICWDSKTEYVVMNRFGESMEGIKMKHQNSIRLFKGSETDLDTNRIALESTIAFRNLTGINVELDEKPTKQICTTYYDTSTESAPQIAARTVTLIFNNQNASRDFSRLSGRVRLAGSSDLFPDLTELGPNGMPEKIDDITKPFSIKLDGQTYNGTFLLKNNLRTALITLAY